jgi:hypothetical protein
MTFSHAAAIRQEPGSFARSGLLPCEGYWLPGEGLQRQLPAHALVEQGARQRLELLPGQLRAVDGGVREQLVEPHPVSRTVVAGIRRQRERELQSFPAAVLSRQGAPGSASVPAGHPCSSRPPPDPPRHPHADPARLVGRQPHPSLPVVRVYAFRRRRGTEGRTAQRPPYRPAHRVLRFRLDARRRAILASSGRPWTGRRPDRSRRGQHHDADVTTPMPSLSLRAPWPSPAGRPARQDWGCRLRLTSPCGLLR